MPRIKENNLFERIVKKDYKNELEEILEEKYFGENVKSLLLEILYKIETAYKDYETVKIGTKAKDEYINSFIEIIQNQCKTIKIVKPNSEESKILDNKTFLVNKKRGEIICLPIARKLLYAIAKISKKERIVNKKYSLLSITISNMINVGSNINMVEPLRDFNGWSWTTVTREYESIEYNLIYQVLLILAGEKLLADWTKNSDSIIDYLEELEEVLIYRYGSEISENLMTTIKKLSVLMELKVNPDIKEIIKKSKLKLEKELKSFDDKETYIKKLTSKKNRLTNKIMKIDTTINDKKLLQEEYVKRNAKLSLEEKIFSMRVLAEIMIEEREKLFEELQDCNDLLKPKKFIEKKEKLENEYNILKLADINNIESELKENLIQLQEMLLNCFKIKIIKAQDKHQIIKLMYQFRYYCLLPYSLKTIIYDFKGIQKNLNETGRLLIRKAIEQKAIFPVSENEVVNYEIEKNIFNVRIINLEELSLKVMKENDEYFIQIFDDKAFDKKVKINIENLNKKMLNIRLNKKFRLFE